MFMQIAIGAIGIGIVLMVGYLIIAQVKSALVSSGATTTGQGTDNVTNACYDVTETLHSSTAACNATCWGGAWDNTSAFLPCPTQNITKALRTTQVTIFAGFALIAVGIIVLAAFGLINIFQ